MLRVGLTGGIGCGKTTVAGFLRECGIPVLDADPLAQKLMAPGGPAHDDVVREFGAGILDAHGGIDRGKLAELAFANHASLAKLNELVHPHVAGEIEKQFAEWSRPGGPALAVVEAALLIEAGYRDKLDRMIVVWCRPEQQRDRLLARGLGEEQARLRMAAQMPADAKRRFATDEIDNSEAIEQTRQQVQQLCESLRRQSSALYGERL
jgi:dephospho-CoA kinase